jgi:hypothetical protein
MENGELPTSNVLFPARILTDLPLACHEAGVSLQGFSIGCFPLIKGFESLLSELDMEDGCARLKDVFQHLKISHFGMRGMGNTPRRSSRPQATEVRIVDAYLGAACSSPALASLGLCMRVFEVDDGRAGIGKPHICYRTGVILGHMTSQSVHSFHVGAIELGGSKLEAIANTISATHVKSVSLCSVTLTQGQYGKAMDILHAKVRAQHGTPRGFFSSLQGAEFGVPKGDDKDDHQNPQVEDGEDYDEAYDRWWNMLQAKQHPELQQMVNDWVSRGSPTEANPLLSSKTSGAIA